MEKFDQFNRAYIYYTVNIINVLKLSNNKHYIFLPSSEILNNERTPFLEYYLSKKLVEIFTKYQNNLNSKIKIYTKRLPLFNSNQTNISIFNIKENQAINRIFIDFLKK